MSDVEYELRREVWICRWFGLAGDLLEPRIFLPYLFTFMWMTILLQTRTTLRVGSAAILAAILSAVTMVAGEASLPEGAARLRPGVAVVDLSLAQAQ